MYLMVGQSVIYSKNENFHASGTDSSSTREKKKKGHKNMRYNAYNTIEMNGDVRRICKIRGETHVL